MAMWPSLDGSKLRVRLRNRPKGATTKGESILSKASASTTDETQPRTNSKSTADTFVPKRTAKSIDDILKPGGDFLGTVHKGATPNIRTVASQDFIKLQEQLLNGAKQTGTYSGGKGTWYELPSGGRVGVRTSDKSGMTLDIDIPGYPKGFKVHQR